VLGEDESGKPSKKKAKKAVETTEGAEVVTPIKGQKKKKAQIEGGENINDGGERAAP